MSQFSFKCLTISHIYIILYLLFIIKFKILSLIKTNVSRAKISSIINIVVQDTKYDCRACVRCVNAILFILCLQDLLIL